MSLLAWRLERRRADVPWAWPAFWLVTAAVLTAMAIGRLLNLDDLATEIGRGQATARGWYENRRRGQAVVVGAIGLFWLCAVTVALARVPERRRRYLPVAIMVLSLLCFAAVRLVSLHQVDAALYRRHIQDVRVGTAIELVGLAILIVLIGVTMAGTHKMAPRQASAGLSGQAQRTPPVRSG